LDRTRCGLPSSGIADLFRIVETFSLSSVEDVFITDKQVDHMLDHKIELLRQVSLFAGLNDAQLEAIADIGEKRFFESGENIITQGGKGEIAFLIMTGKAGCLKQEKGQTFVEDLWPGTLVGELGMLIETVHGVTVTASERLRALAINREAFRAIMEAHPIIAKHISEKLLVRLHGLAAQLREVDGKLAEIERAA
jgi:CRP/FNR family transcriptional regulator, cyclic AMP receptor protein